MRIKDRNHIVISGWMYRLGLSSILEVIAFAAVYGFSQDNSSEFKGSITFIQDFLMCSRPTAIKVMRNLEDKGLIIKRQFEDNGVVLNRYSANLEVVNSFNHPQLNDLTTPSKADLPHISKDNNSDNSSSNSPIINNSPITPTNTPFIPQGGKPKESGKTELNFSIVQPEFGNVVLKWLTYKKERKQTYKQMGFNSFYNKLIKLSGGDPNIADMIVEQSMANNYQGIFELKGGNNGNSTSRPTDAQALKAAIDQSWGPDGDPLADIL